MCTGDAWASAVTRVMFYDGGIVSPVPVIFFVSYMLLAAIVLIDIIIAVLLDEFLTTMSKSRNEIEAEEVLDDNPSLEGHSLDPLMAVLAQFQSSTDLLESIKGIYIRLDEDGSGGIGLCTVWRVCTAGNPGKRRQPHECAGMRSHARSNPSALIHTNTQGSRKWRSACRKSFQTLSLALRTFTISRRTLSVCENRRAWR